MIKKPCLTQADVRSLYRLLPPIVGGDERFTWAFRQKAMRWHVENSQTLDDFLRWSTLIESMVIGDAPYIEEEWLWLGNLDGWRDVCTAPSFGQAEKSALYGDATGTYIHQAYHMALWEQNTCSKINACHSIIEFGAGIGVFAHIAWRRGFRGKYTIVDLPELLILAEYYLGNVGVLDDLQVEFVADYGDRAPEIYDLTVGIASLSETDWNTRREFFEKFPSMQYLIVAQDVFYDLDNKTYFSGFQDAMVATGKRVFRSTVSQYPSHEVLHITTATKEAP